MAQDFIWIPSYGSAVSTKPNVKVVKFGDGYEQRVAVGLNTALRKWEVTFASRANETADTIEAFFEARGALEWFNWTPPHGAAGQWVCREWAAQKTGPLTRTVTATFDEIVAV